MKQFSFLLTSFQHTASNSFQGHRQPYFSTQYESVSVDASVDAYFLRIVSARGVQMRHQWWKGGHYLLRVVLIFSKVDRRRRR